MKSYNDIVVLRLLFSWPGKAPDRGNLRKCLSGLIYDFHYGRKVRGQEWHSPWQQVPMVLSSSSGGRELRQKIPPLKICLHDLCQSGPTS